MTVVVEALLVEVLDLDMLVVWLCRRRSRRELIFELCLRVPTKGERFAKPGPGSRTEEGQQHLV